MREKPRELENQNRLFASLFLSRLFWMVAAFGLNFEIYFFWRRFFWLPIPTSTLLAWATSVFFAFLYTQDPVFSSSFGKDLLRYYGFGLWYGILDLSLMTLFIFHFHVTQFSSKLLTLLIVFFSGFVAYLWKRKAKAA